MFQGCLTPTVPIQQPVIMMMITEKLLRADDLSEEGAGVREFMLNRNEG